MKRLFILLLILLNYRATYAPEWKYIDMEIKESINPFETIFKAICEYESKSDAMAWNEKENAVGIAQIREIRIKDFNQLTGKNYQLREMHDINKSKEVFMFYAKRLKDYDLIIRRWNGSGPDTYKYLKHIKQIMYDIRKAN